MSENQTFQTNNGQPGKEQWIPTWAGIALILVLVATFIFFFWRFQETGDSVKQAVESQKAINEKNSDQIVSQENPATGSTAPSPAADATAAPATPSQSSGSTVDVNYEVKKLDESANSVSENDFDSNSFSNVQIGL